MKICTKALDEARRKMVQVLILDTAGRTQIDDALMEELKAIKKKVEPDEVLFVADAMMGQQAASVAGTFHEAVGIDGVVLTKMDGDTRGGAALSIKKTTGKPIRFIGTGEKLDALEPFYPRPAGLAHPRDGRCDVAGGKGRADLRPGAAGGAGEKTQKKPFSRSRISATS